MLRLQQSMERRLAANAIQQKTKAFMVKDLNSFSLTKVQTDSTAVDESKRTSNDEFLLHNYLIKRRWRSMEVTVSIVSSEDEFVDEWASSKQRR